MDNDEQRDATEEPRQDVTAGTLSASNCAFVRKLLREREPAFAACLELAARITAEQKELRA